MTAAARWREQLASWAIPERFTAAVRDSPWQLPAAAIAQRTDRQVASPAGESYPRAAEVLDPPGTVLDVGAGAGAASLPLAGRITELTAVDQSQSMLDGLAARAAALSIPVRTVVGRWPDVAELVSTVDLVVCHHVVYNVPDLAQFALALAAKARRRVVVELTEQHPMWVLNPYWKAMHGLDRPDRPTADDAIAVLREAGLAPHVVRWRRPRTPQTFQQYVDSTAGAVCVPPQRRKELADLIREYGGEPPDRAIVTLWWDSADRDRRQS